MKKVIALLLLVFFAASAPASNGLRLSYNDYTKPGCRCNSTPCVCPPQGSCSTGPVYGSPPCPPPCDPCAPVCGTDCGLTICAMGAAVLAVIAAAAIVLTSGVHQHAH